MREVTHSKFLLIPI